MSDMPRRPESLPDNDRLQSEASLEALCQRYKAVVLHRDNQTLHVACHETEADTDALSNVLRFTTGLKVQLERWPQTRLEQVMEQGNSEIKKKTAADESWSSAQSDENNELN